MCPDQAGMSTQGKGKGPKGGQGIKFAEFLYLGKSETCYLSVLFDDFLNCDF